VSDEHADLEHPGERGEVSPSATTGEELLAAALALVAEAEAALGDVERALERLEQGTYVQCEVCGAAIEPTVLNASPTTRRCAAHAEGTS
jgi:DnaK suppressor protein